jgi:hypothetical protein
MLIIFIPKELRQYQLALIKRDLPTQLLHAKLAFLAVFLFKFAIGGPPLLAVTRMLLLPFALLDRHAIRVTPAPIFFILSLPDGLALGLGTIVLLFGSWVRIKQVSAMITTFSSGLGWQDGLFHKTSVPYHERKKQMGRY